MYQKNKQKHCMVKIYSYCVAMVTSTDDEINNPNFT